MKKIINLAIGLVVMVLGAYWLLGSTLGTFRVFNNDIGFIGFVTLCGGFAYMMVPME